MSKPTLGSNMPTVVCVHQKRLADAETSSRSAMRTDHEDLRLDPVLGLLLGKLERGGDEPSPL
jgi:hypothetical protein